MWPADRLLDAAAPHHHRTRSSGEQRGITVKADGTCEVQGQPSMQVSARFSLECPQLPKLMVHQW
jgi:hypothetical protein